MASILGEATVQELREQARGEVIAPSDEGYDAARAIWNAMADRRPALILRCAGVADVMLGVQFARSQGLELAVRGGGHSLPGFSSTDGGVVLDLSAMKGIRVDPDAERAVVQPGVTWGDFDHETQAFGLATTGGLVSTTGVAGLTLGGGIGWLMRRHGLTCDNLAAADVVTADGRLVRASEDEHPDLLWALRGGGGNFGVVVSFEFRLHPVGPVVLAGPIFFPGDQAAEVARRYREYVADLPDEMTSLLNFTTAPPAPFLPEATHGTPVVAAVGCYAGSPDEGEKVAAGLRELGTPIADLLGPMPYTMLQGLLDPFYGPGARNYFKAGYLSELSDAVIEQILTFHASRPSPVSEIHVQHLGGAIARVGADDTAFGARDATFVFNLVARWQDAAEDDAAQIGWARDLYASVEPQMSGGAYVNFISAGDDRVAEAYPGRTLERLAAVKRTWDPTNLFHLNQNIQPG
jgi:FAD binding domain/Berberine and berberine like